MTDSEMRELDAWIAERVMGYRWWFCVLSTEAMLERPDCGSWPERHDFKIQAEKPKLCTDKTDLSLFKPTTDPAAAMMVLDKCFEKLATVSIEKRGDIYCIWVSGNYKGTETFADTLPLAICEFAKKLFT